MDITELLAFSVKHKASDLHLSAGVSPLIRVDGDVRPQSGGGAPGDRSLSPPDLLSGLRMTQPRLAVVQTLLARMGARRYIGLLLEPEPLDCQWPIHRGERSE